ncbi:MULTISPECIES: SapC family protein [unclassified Thioalkalivibrio]|uniref:SapC family protein n=1 Tax=unclassified Thioalkalivibrio TaxID=2621013 RepID=UPI000362A842|nr:MULTISPECIES: SapC family protein [unclassified Thioalkalivibrio]PYG03847.1 SapC protein [Thioalkalivibrio sp. ALE21]
MFRTIMPLSRAGDSLGVEWEAGFEFARGSERVEIGLSECIQAAAAMPLALVKDPEQEAFRVVAVMGVEDNDNLLVDDDGHWHAGYTPSALRLYPFTLSGGTNGADPELAYDAASGMVHVGGSQRLLDDGQPTELPERLIKALRWMEEDKIAARIAAQSLEVAGVVGPWEPSITLHGEEVSPRGLYGVDQKALAGLRGPMLEALNDAGGLLLAHAQLVSMNNFPFLGRRLHEAEKQARPMLFDA